MQERTGENTDEEGAVDLFCDESQADCDNGREERPEGAVNSITRGNACYHQKCDNDHGGDGKDDFLCF